MRKLYSPLNQKTISQAIKNMSIEHNVTLRVLDADTHEIIQEHEGHNAATNSLLTGIAHYLVGDGVYNQAYDMLSDHIPRYISLGTMGLFTQAEDEYHLPVGLGYDTDSLDPNATDSGVPLYYGDPETERLCHYISQCPGFGADGYDVNNNNGRLYFGLGPKFEDREFSSVISCELISDTYPRTAISYREIVPEQSAEVPKTIDIIYSGIISVGSLSQFRYDDAGNAASYIFITEAGLWSKKVWENSGDNGLLAGYRIAPTSESTSKFGSWIEGSYEGSEWIPGHFDLDYEIVEGEKVLTELGEQQLANQDLLKKSILRVGLNQVVQVIWKIQLGGLEQLSIGSTYNLYDNINDALLWHFWDEH